MTIKEKMASNSRFKPLYVINSAAFLSLRDVYLKEKDRLCKTYSNYIEKKFEF